jgi:hypothetical protein
VKAGSVGDIGNAGGAGRSVLGEAVKGSSITDGASGEIVTDGVVEALEDSGERDVGVANSGVAGLDMGERRSLPSSPYPRINSASFRRLLTLLAGGVFASGGEGGGGEGGDGAVGAGDAVFDRRSSSQAWPATSDSSGQSGLWLAAVAALPRRLQRRRQRRRCRPAVAAVSVGAVKMQVTVMVCDPAAWLIATRALCPLSMQRSYSATKSALEMDGGVVGWPVLPRR